MAKNLVIIPTYNEKENLKKLIPLILSIQKNLDILVVDDNSPDGTGDLVKSVENKNKGIHLISRPSKLGLGSAYIKGFEFALKNHYNYAISMDADFSHDPNVISVMLKHAQNYDLIVGSRYIKGGEIIGWERYRYFLSKLANFFARLLLGLKQKDVTSGFKCYSRKLLENLGGNMISSGYVFQVETVFRAQSVGAKILEIPIIFRERHLGKSKISRKEIFGGFVNILKLTWQRRGIQQMIKFSLVGALNTLVDLGFLNFFVLVLKLNVYLSGILAVLIAIANSYFWNKKWTFRGISGKKKLATEITQFFIVMGSGALLNIGIYSFLIAYFGLWYNWAKLLAIILVVLWNFILSKYWVFKS